jgi:hypothetical protein
VVSNSFIPGLVVVRHGRVEEGLLHVLEEGVGLGRKLVRGVDDGVWVCLDRGVAGRTVLGPFVVVVPEVAEKDNVRFDKGLEKPRELLLTGKLAIFINMRLERGNSKLVRGRLHVFNSAYDFMHDLHASQIRIKLFI